MSTGSIRNPPPLSLPLSAHPLYSEIVRIGKGGGKILDLGCGRSLPFPFLSFHLSLSSHVDTDPLTHSPFGTLAGKDLMQLINDGVPAFNVVGMDKESGVSSNPFSFLSRSLQLTRRFPALLQFQNLISATARREGIPEPIAFVSGDVTTLLPTSNEISEPRLDSWFATHRSTFSVVICNVSILLPPLLHTHPYPNLTLISLRSSATPPPPPPHRPLFSPHPPPLLLPHPPKLLFPPPRRSATRPSFHPHLRGFLNLRLPLHLLPTQPERHRETLALGGRRMGRFA